MKIWPALLAFTLVSGAWGLANLVWSFDCLTSTGENEKAVKSCTAVIDGPLVLSAFQTSAIKRRSVAHLALENYQDVIKDVSRLAGKGSASGLDYQNRGIAKYQLVDLEGAIEDLQSAARLLPVSEEILADLGNVLLETGKNDDALLVAEAFLKRSANSAIAQRLRGKVRYFKDEYDLALADYNSAITHYPEYALWLNERALVEDAKKNTTAALADYGKAIELSPKDIQFKINRAQLLAYMGKETEALADFDTVAGIERTAYHLALKADVLIRLNRLDEAQKVADEALKLDGKSEFVLTILGRLLSGKGDYKNAQAKYDEALALNPDHNSARYWIAMLRSLEGKYVTSYRILTSLESVWPNDAPLQNEIGLALMSQGLYEKAIPAFSKAVELDSDFPHAYENRARANIILDRWQAAIDDANHALEIDNKRPVAFWRRAYANWKSGKIDAALEDFNKTIELDPNFRVALEERAEFYLATEKPELALLDAERALTFETRDYDTYRVRGRVAERLEKYDEAVDYYSKAIELNHYNSWLIEDRAWAYLGLNEPLRALADCITLIQHKPDQPDGYRCRAKANQKIDNLPKALDDLNRALDIRAEFHAARFDRGYVLLSMQRREEAIRDFTDTIKSDFRTSESYFYRGIAQEDEGNASAALRDYEKALPLANKYWAAEVSARLRSLKAKTPAGVMPEPPDYPQVRSAKRG